MTDNIYEGEPDNRLDKSVEEPSRFRPKYRKLEPTEIELHDEIKSSAERLESLYKKIEVRDGKDARYYKEAMLALEASVMWAIKELTA